MKANQVPLGVRNNNPLKIRYNPMYSWKGQTGSNEGFCTFASMELGFRAALVLLCNFQRKGYDTVRKIVAHWAPPSENDTKAYIDFCCHLRGVHFDPDFDLDPDERITDMFIMEDLCWTMALYECGGSNAHNEALCDAFIHATCCASRESLRIVYPGIKDTFMKGYGYPELNKICI